MCRWIAARIVEDFQDCTDGTAGPVMTNNSSRQSNSRPSGTAAWAAVIGGVLWIAGMTAAWTSYDLHNAQP